MMRGETQEDLAEGAIKWMIKVPKFSADFVVWALKAMMKSLLNKEPVGKQKIERLMKDGKHKLEQMSLSDVGKDMKEFQKLARKYGVGFTAFKSGEDYTLFFRAERAEQMKSCLEAYSQQKLAAKPQKQIKTRLEEAIQRKADKNIEPALKEAKEYNKVQTRGRN